LQTSESSVGHIDTIKIADLNLILDLYKETVRQRHLLHEKHECDTWHQPPINLIDKLFVQRCHILIAQITESVKSSLDLLRRDIHEFLNNLLELGVLLLAHCGGRILEIKCYERDAKYCDKLFLDTQFSLKNDALI
jgi:hypothetical protein